MFSTVASANCRDEVAAAFERLGTSRQPYRKEVTIVVSERQTAREIVEVVPPDRRRELTSNGVSGYGTSENIRVGEREWSHVYAGPWGWREWRPEFLRGTPASDADSDKPIPEDAVFECLGAVEFNGKKYLGYQSRLKKVISVFGEISEEVKERLSRQLAQMPQEWRTIFVDPQSKLPAYEIVAAEGKLDSPRVKEQYAYPGRIKIAPPLWCSIGLCRKFPY
jgi:hypothetical protein